jgi:nitrogen fixation protein FixH
MNIRAPSVRQPREVTGRMVLFCFIAFFGVIAAVNAVMIRFAVTTFAGLQTDSAYRAGLAYPAEEARAARQDDLHWQVEGQVARDAAGATQIDVSVRDAKGQPVQGVVVNARLAHPAITRRDHVLSLQRDAGGRHRGTTDAAVGQWVLTLDVIRGEERLYRSVSRVMLR